MRCDAVIGMDSEVITERPNTRRSHVRSRGADEIAPGTGLEAVPAAAAAAKVDLSSVLLQPRPVEQQPTAPTTTTAAAAPTAGSVKTRLYVRPAPLVAQQRLYGGQQGQGTTSAAVPTATARLQAPDAPRTSSSSVFGGRSGRNISSVAHPAAAIQTGRYVAATTTTTAKSSIIDPHLRKPNPPVAANEVLKPMQ